MVLECPQITFESLVFSRVLQTSSKEEELKEGESLLKSLTSPDRKKTAVTPTSLRMAISGYLRLGHWWITSTMQQASSPKWEPAGPTSALLGTKMALARLPTIPEPR